MSWPLPLASYLILGCLLRLFKWDSGSGEANTTAIVKTILKFLYSECTFGDFGVNYVNLHPPVLPQCWFIVVEVLSRNSLFVVEYPSKCKMAYFMNGPYLLWNWVATQTIEAAQNENVNNTKNFKVNLCQISAHSDKHSDNIFLRVVQMSWNFVRFHEIINQRDAKNFRFLSWQTKKFYS